MTAEERAPLKILVCIKQAPDLESAFRINEEGSGYDETGLVFRPNKYDENALEEAALLKERFANTQFTALTVGPRQWEAAARRGLEFGADFGVHIVTPDFQRLDALQTASFIAAYAGRGRFDLLLFGVMSEDEERSQVGPMTAALLDLPCATTVVKETISEDFSRVEVERELEGGRREIIEMPLPAALTVQSSINLPRYPNLTNKLRARKQEITLIHASTLPTPRKCSRPVRAYLPPPSKMGAFIGGTVEEQAETLIRLIHEKTGVL